jgi:hypothetical protein
MIGGGAGAGALIGGIAGGGKGAAIGALVGGGAGTGGAGLTGNRDVSFGAESACHFQAKCSSRDTALILGSTFSTPATLSSGFCFLTVNT